MHITNKRFTRPTPPTVLIIYPYQDLSDFIREELIELGCNVIVVHTRDAALAALAQHPDMVILDVVMSRLDVSCQWECLTIRLNRINLEESLRKGIALAKEIRGQVPSIPVIFTSIERWLLQSLPFGESFCLFNENHTLSSLVEQMLVEHSLPSQIEQLDTATVLELPKKVGTMYQLAAA